MNSTVQIQPETSRWRSRDVRYYSGGWDDVLSVLPDFETVPFRAGPEEPSNPFLVTVSRKPLSDVERPMPVGVVSHRYSLIQHRDVAMRCREGLEQARVDSAELRYEVGVSQLGEWMNFRIYSLKSTASGTRMTRASTSALSASMPSTDRRVSSCCWLVPLRVCKRYGDRQEQDRNPRTARRTSGD